MEEQTESVPIKSDTHHAQLARIEGLITLLGQKFDTLLRALADEDDYPTVTLDGDTMPAARDENQPL